MIYTGRITAIASLIIFFIVSIYQVGLGQNPQLKIWSLPDQYIDFTQSTPLVQPLPAYFTQGQPVAYTHNIMHDDNGNLLFFMVDENIYHNDGNYLSLLGSSDATDQDGVPMSNYANYSSGSFEGSTEHIIVPVPGDCEKYYIIAAKQYHGLPFGDPIVHYFLIDRPTNTSVFQDVNFDNGEFLSLFTAGANAPKDHYIQMAVTPLRTDGTRFLYIAKQRYLYKFIIDNAGITKAWRETVSNQPHARSEMEIIQIYDDASFVYKLAFASVVQNLTPSVPPQRSIKVFTLNENGDIQTREEMGLDVASVEYVKGIELYRGFMYYTSTKPPYLYYASLSTLTPQPLTAATLGSNPTANLADFSETQIEMAYDGKLYYAAQDRLACLANPNNPAGSAWDDQAITGLNIPKSYGEFPSSSVHGIRILPDQIDGEVVHGALAFSQTSTYTATTSATWTPSSNPFGNKPTVVFHNQLIIPEGVSITIKDMIVKFKEAVGVTVERSNTSGVDGGELVLDNTTLSSFDDCGTESKMWKGINLHGKKLATQFANPDKVQGKIVLKNNSIIENAIYAISTYNPATGDPINYTGGIIEATNSTFRNNVQAIQMYVYQNFIPVNGQAYKDLSFFTNCTFETTRELNDPLLSPFRFVGLFEVSGINFLGNTFQNTTPLTFDQATVSKRGSGIESVGSGFSVKALCQDQQPASFPCQNTKSNTFEGLHYGIQNFAFSGFDNMVVDDAKFIDNKAGIRLNGVNYSTITSSTFTVAPYMLPFPYDHSELPYGLYLNGCTGYKVEGNNFNASDPGAQVMLGTVVFNSGDLPNMIYRNTYENLYVNLLAEGDNRGLGAEDGLQIKCNDFFNLRDQGFNSGWDIAVTKLGFGSIAEGIAKFQGTCDNADLSSPVGNRFYLSSCPINDDAKIFYNSGILTGNVVYSHNPDLITDPQNTNCYNEADIFRNPCSVPFNEPTSCPSTFRRRPILEIVELNPGCVYINGHWICKKDMLVFYASKATGLAARIDGGNTLDLLAQIASGTPPGALKNELLAASPYLSDKVLISAISAGLPPGILKDILIANSPLSSSVLDALSSITLPNGITNQINVAQVGISGMTVLESQIAYYQSRRELGVSEMIRYFLKNDNLSEARNEVLTLLKEEGLNDPREGREHEQVAANIVTEDLNEAEAVLNTIHQGPPDNACKLLQLEIDLKRANKSVKQLSKPQEDMVRQIAAEIKYKAGAKAQSILKASHSEVTKETIILPVKNQLKLAFEEESSYQLSIAKSLQVFPNPFRDYATIEAYIPEETVIGQVRIIDMLGVTHKVIQVNNGYNDLTLLKGDLPSSGIYFCLLEADDELIDKIKFISLR